MMRRRTPGDIAVRYTGGAPLAAGPSLLHFARPVQILTAPSRKPLAVRVPLIDVRPICYAFPLTACGRPRCPGGIASMSWFGDGSRGSSIPTPQALLRSVYAGRLCVAFAIYLAAALKFAVAAPLDLLVTSFVLVATVVVTSASYWYTHFLRRSPGRTFLYGQALFDIALITTVVHITGGPQSDLTPLYVPLVAVAAVPMPPASTGLLTALA